MKIHIVLKQTEIDTLANKYKSIPSVAMHGTEEKH
jgi:hypothetical protein